MATNAPPPAYNPNAPPTGVQYAPAPPAGAQPVVQYVQGQPVQYVQQPVTVQPQVIYVQQPVQQQSIQTRTIAPTFGLNSTHALCPQCQQQVSTKVKCENGGATWACAGILCLLGCWCGCSCAPFCMDDLKNTYHSCPNCNTIVGQKKGNIGDCMGGMLKL